MNTLKQALDMELSELKLSQEKKDVVLSKRQKVSFGRHISKAACVCMLIMLGGTSVYAGQRLYNKIQVNQMNTSILDDMQVKNVRYIKTSENKNGDYEAKYSDYSTLQKDINLRLLTSPMQDKDGNMMIRYLSDNENWVSIKIGAYITGDCTDIQMTEDEKSYTYTAGLEYGSPIDMEIDIMTSEEQKAAGWDREFLGSYNSARDMIIAGVKVNFIVEYSKDNEESRTKSIAVFVKDGIRYVMSGKISEEKMEEIILTMLS